MTRVRVSDLGPAARAQIADALDHKTGAGRRKPSRAGIGEAQPCPGHCHCGAAFPSFTKWLRHLRNEHANNGRWSIDLDTQETP